MGRHECLFAVASAAALAVAGSAWAQAAPLPASSQSVELQEIVVTATRQEQVLSKVPLSVSAFTEQKMDVQGVKSFSDIALFTPGVTFDVDDKDISIRGINSDAGSGTTGIYIDDTPIQMRKLGFNSNNSLPEVFDLDRVEVLRGPQGTLFGAGSEGGTVRYIATQPGLSDYSSYGRAELAGTQGGGLTYEAGAAVGGPLIQDKLGFRISAYHRRDGGYVDRVDSATGATVKKNANSEDTTILRAAVTLAPTSNLQITPGVNYQYREQHDTESFWVGLSDLGNHQFINGNPSPQADKDEFYLPTLKIEYDFGPVKVISNTAYFYRSEYVNGYEGTIYNLSFFQQGLADPANPTTPFGDECDTCRTDLYPLLTANGINLPDLANYKSPATLTNRQSNFTQEIRLQSTDPSSRLNWTVGLFYAQDRQQSIEEIHDPMLADITQYLFGMDVEDVWGVPLLPNGDDYINSTIGHDRQIALFGDATFNVTEQLKLIAGFRYAKTRFDFTNFADGPQNGGPTGGAGRKSESPFTPKLGVSYQLDPDNLFYFTWAKGYRIGGANAPIPELECSDDFTLRGIDHIPESYNSDTVSSFELGSKNKLFDRRLQVEASVYHIDWKNIQQNDSLTGCGLQYTTNLGDVTSQGFDLQAQWRVVQGLVVEGSVGYTQARYSTTARTGSGADAPILASKGDAIDGSPWTASLGAQYDFQAFDHDAYVRGDYEYTSALRRPTIDLDPATAAYDPALVNPPSTSFVSARGGATIGKWNVSLFIDNLFDAHPRLTYFHSDSDTLLFQESTFRPRTFGITGTVRY